MSRPELTGHAAHFYNEKEARKYDSSSRMIGVQREITERAIELLKLDALDHPALVLDAGRACRDKCWKKRAMCGWDAMSVVTC
jgi:18S rRNA (guanine1575-N7)-methyltransferase